MKSGIRHNINQKRASLAMFILDKIILSKTKIVSRIGVHKITMKSTFLASNIHEAHL